MNRLIRRRSLGYFVTVWIIAALVAGCGNKETGEVPIVPPPSFTQLPAIQPTVELPIQPRAQPEVEPTPTIFALGPLFDPTLDLWARPVSVPLELRIPSLKVNAPVLGVGLTSGNQMDAPKGPIGDPVWHTAFWYRGSGIPGEPGTATLAGHVNTPLG